MTTPDYDLIVVGSGPVGAAIARTVFDDDPAARVLMVEVGPELTARAGASVRNLPAAERTELERRSEGLVARPTSEAVTAHKRPVARSGTFLVNADASLSDPDLDMPAAAMSANVGGLGAHWTCACPRPGNTETIPFIAPSELAAAYDEAARLLHVTQDAYPRTAVREAVERALGAVVDAGRPADRRVQPMPLAATPTASGRPTWSGPDVILGDLADPELRDPRFELRSRTLARRVLYDESGHATALEAESLETGERTVIGADVIAVAADSFRTPQLLWASGIRPHALGRYLNDQPQIMCAVYLDPALAAGDAALDSVDNPREQLTGVSWIPFHAPDYPFHGQIMQREASPLLVGAQDEPDPRPIVSLGCFTTKELRADDRVEFDEVRTDAWGMPAIRIHYELTDRDRRTIDRALDVVADLAAHVGEYIPGGAPRVVPAGSSLHYQGSFRTGPLDDGTSVCDPAGRVWGFDNLFVGGNGIIPTATASNPTFTSVALAVRSAHAIAALLREGR